MSARPPSNLPGTSPLFTIIRFTAGLLVERAQFFTGLTEKSALVREALMALIERERVRRLALLGGAEPQLEAIARAQSEPAA